jgi:signal peptide peptidase SppA
MTETSRLARTFDALRSVVPRRFRPDIPVVPTVRLTGVIGFSTPLKPGLTLATCARPLDRAFAVRRARAVALLINSPGGSAVQSHLIFRRIRAYADEKKLPVFAFVEDAAASGGYMIACAADEIFSDPTSIVGSIGVVSASFGFDRLIERIGVDRRVHTAGRNKAILDPFQPEKPEEVERLKDLQRRIHDVFVDLVRSRRGAKLDEANEELFSGAFWVGSEALGLGLVDGLGDIRTIMRQRFGEDVRLRMIEPARPPLLARLLGRRVPGQVGLALEPASLIDPAEVVATLEERAAWSRLGL